MTNRDIEILQNEVKYLRKCNAELKREAEMDDKIFKTIFIGLALIGLFWPVILSEICYAH